MKKIYTLFFTLLTVFYTSCNNSITVSIEEAPDVIKNLKGEKTIIIRGELNDENFYFLANSLRSENIRVNLDLSKATNAGDISFPDLSYCISLKKITLPQYLWIENDIFKECKFLEEVIIPDGITEIERFAFENCTSLKKVSIPPSIDEIGAMAFAGCTSLEEITIPHGVLGIANNVFNGCTSLKRISLPESLVTLDENAFCDCKSLVELKLPYSIDFFSVSICSGCDSLQSLVLPNWVSGGFCCLFGFAGKTLVDIIVYDKYVSSEQLSCVCEYFTDFKLYEVSGRENKKYFIELIRAYLRDSPSNISELYAKAILGE